jgi:thymidylate kinase
MTDESTGGEPAGIGGAPSPPVVSEGWAVSFIRSLFSDLDEAGIGWLVLRNHQELPDRVGHDLDILVHPGDIARVDPVVRATVKRRGLLLLRADEGIEHMGFIVADPDLRGRLSLKLDVQGALRFRGRTFIDPDDLFANRRQAGGIWAPTAGMEAYALLLHAALHKAELKAKYADRVRALQADEPGGLPRVAVARLPSDVARRMAEVRSEGDLLPLKGPLGRAIDRRYPANLWRRPLFVVRSGVRMTRLRLRPRGLFVVFLGPDGAGKSSTTDMLATMLSAESNALSVHRVYLGSGQPLLPTRRFMRWVRGKGRGQTDVKKKVRDVEPRRLRGALHVMVDEILRYWVQVRPKLAPHGIVLADRYAYDVLRVNNPTVRKPWFRKLATKLIPDPDITFFLEGDPAVITARKSELTLNETVRQQTAYRELADLIQDFRPIDLSVRDEAALRGIARQILEAYAMRNNGLIPETSARNGR